MLVKNNAYATITGSISAGTANPLTITVTSGQGSRFSTITNGSGRWFMAALVDEGPNKVEIVHCYQHDSGSPDTFICLRARDGTTARDWSGGDNLIQISDCESGWSEHLDRFQLKGVAVAGGTANALTASFTCGYQQLVDGMRFRLRASAANTAAMTFAPTLDHSAFGGTTYVMSARAIVKGNNAALVGGEVPGAGYHIDLVYRSPTDDFLLLNPYLVLSSSVINPLVNNASLINTNYYGFSGSPHTYNKTVNNPSFIVVEIIAGGGGGGGVNNSNATKSAGGGGAGQYGRKRIANGALGTTTTVTIGQGGPGGTASGGSGSVGGPSSFGAHISASGGAGGQGSGGDSGAGGAAGTGGVGGDFYIQGQAGAEGGNDGPSGSGGSSYFGFGGQSKSISGDGLSATGYGAGGGGGADFGTTGRTGGSGSAGLCIVYEYK